MTTIGMTNDRGRVMALSALLRRSDVASDRSLP